MINNISNIAWALFLPFLIVVSIYLIYKYNKDFKKNIATEKLELKRVIGQTSISLGTMIGTGAIIGVLGSLATMYINGQAYFEAIIFWALIGVLVLVPLAYFETIVSKTTNMNPKQYISILISKKAALVYAISFCVLHVFGFGGFQFQGINSVFTILGQGFFHIELTKIQRYIFIIVPLLIFISVIILTKKHDVFISAMGFMIGLAVILYILFAILFLIRTGDYISIFFSNMIKGITNPITSVIGIPIGMTFSFQRILQASEPGLGAFALSSLDNDIKAKPSAWVSSISAIITIFISLFITTFIVSYANYNGFIDLNNVDSLNLLTAYFYTAYDVLGYFGIFILTIFALLSGITTLLGAFYFFNVLFDLEYKLEFTIYIILLLLSGTFAIFGAMFIFNVIDLLLFIVGFINVVAILLYFKKKDKIM